MIAEGTDYRFSHAVTTATPERKIWQAWTDVPNWGRWDGGLKAASLDGAFGVGAQGAITALSGSHARFTITEVELNRSYAFVTSLPLATLTVTRKFLPKVVDGEVRFEHEVSFGGLLGWFWASQFGPGFRRELPATMERLAGYAGTLP